MTLSDKIFKWIMIISVTLIVSTFLYTNGPIFILKLTPYEEELRKTLYPQWISNDEICYVELVRHRDKSILEQGKFAFLIKWPITDVYLYREKINQPETKKLIKHFTRKYFEPPQQIAGVSDTMFGYRVYDDGKKIFMYYTGENMYAPRYRYITMDTTGRNFREKIPLIASLDISQDGKKLYGILEEGNDKYFIAEQIIKTNQINKILSINEEYFKDARLISRGADIQFLKLVSNDKLIFYYWTYDVRSPSSTPYYLYVIDLDKMSTKIIYSYIILKPLILGEGAEEFILRNNIIFISGYGIYEKNDSGWKGKYTDSYLSPDKKHLVVLNQAGRIEILDFEKIVNEK